MTCPTFLIYTKCLVWLSLSVCSGRSRTSFGEGWGTRGFLVIASEEPSAMQLLWTFWHFVGSELSFPSPPPLCFLHQVCVCGCTSKPEWVKGRENTMLRTFKNKGLWNATNNTQGTTLGMLSEWDGSVVRLLVHEPKNLELKSRTRPLNALNTISSRHWVWPWKTRKHVYYMTELMIMLMTICSNYATKVLSLRVI